MLDPTQHVRAPSRFRKRPSEQARAGGDAKKNENESEMERGYDLLAAVAA